VLCIKTPMQRIVTLGREGIGKREDCNECLEGSVVVDLVLPLGKVRSCVLIKLAGLFVVEKPLYQPRIHDDVRPLSSRVIPPGKIFLECLVESIVFLLVEGVFTLLCLAIEGFQSRSVGGSRG